MARRIGNSVTNGRNIILENRGAVEETEKKFKYCQEKKFKLPREIEEQRE
jgi:hypothetical protein